MKVRNYIALLFCVVLIASCSKEFEERTSYDGEDSIRFMSATSTALENSGSVLIPVVFSAANGGTATVTISAGSDELVESVDYVLSTTSLTLQENADDATISYRGNVEVMLIDNDVFTGGTKTIVLTLSNPSSGDVGFSGPDNLNATYVLLVQDDDCPSRNIAGSYTTTTTGTSTDDCCPDAETVVGAVDIVDNGDNTYTIFDWSAGLYQLFYEVYGISGAYVAAGNLNGVVGVICDEISGSIPEPFGGVSELNGTIDLDTGVITYTWLNGFDDTATVILTPQ